MAWLAGWTYRQEIKIKHPSGALTDFQIKFVIAQSDYEHRRYDLSLKGLCKSDFSDIRFTTSDGTTLLDYFIETVYGYSPYQIATLWVEFDSIGTGSTSFYIYFGNAGAAAVSNGANTFPFFDDFDDSSLDGAKWTDLGGTTEAGTTLTIAATSATIRGIIGKVDFGINYAFRMRAYTQHFNNTGFFEQVGWVHQTLNDQLRFYMSHTSATFNYKATNYLNAGTYTNISMYGAIAQAYQIFDIKRNSNVNAIYAVDDQEIVSRTRFGTAIATNLYTGNLVPGATAFNNGAGIVVDWVFVRKYDTVEPEVEGFGYIEEDGVTPVVGWLSDWAYRFKLTLAHSLIDESLIDFPVAIKLGTSVGSGADDVSAIFDELAANSLKIAITGPDGTTQLYCEVASWDNANEKATLHVKIPHLSGIVDTDLYLYYDVSKADNSTYVGVVGSTAGKKVWDRWFLGVYHLNETPTLAGDIKDSTRWAVNGSPGVNAPSLVDAQHDKGLDYEKGSSQSSYVPGKTTTFIDLGINSHSVTVTGAYLAAIYPRINNSSSFYDGSATYAAIADHASWQLGGGTGNFTVEAWATFAVLPSLNLNRTIVSQYVDGSNQWIFGLANVGGTYKLRYYNQTGGVLTIDIAENWTPILNKWYHIAVTRQGNDFKLWVDGAQLGATVVDADSTTNFAASLVIGRLGTSHYHYGYIEELRISDICRYTAAFSPAIDPLESDANTTLLLPFRQQGCSIRGTLFATFENVFNLESLVASSASAAIQFESTANSGYTRLGVYTLYQALADTRLGAIFRDSNTGTAFIATDTVTLSLATWYQSAARLNCAKGLLEIIKNGAVVAQNTTHKVFATFNAPVSEIGLGYAPGTSTYYHDGVIDEARWSIIDRSLAWIKTTYNTLFDLLGNFGTAEVMPTTAAPTTVAPTTLAPTTLAATTLAPTTLGGTTPVPTTMIGTTLAPTTMPISRGVLVGGRLVNKSILFGRLVK